MFGLSYVRLAAAAAAILLAVLALFGAYNHGVSVTEAEWAGKWNAQAAELATAKADAERAQRDEEQRRQAAIDEVKNDAAKQIQRAAADAATARAGADSLREQASRLASAASQTCSHTGFALGSKAGRGTTGLFADLFSEASEEAADMAAAYDRARAAGAACERAYDRVRGER